MLFYSAFCVCFLTTLAFDNKEVKQAEPGKKDTIFANVIKNISRVNNVLQELINNYEQLQKMYISQESFDGPEDSSDTDRLLENDKKSKNASHTTPTLYKFYNAGTKMILSDIELDKEKQNKPDIQKTTREAFDPLSLSASSDIEETVETASKEPKQLKVSRTVKTAVTTTTERNTVQQRQQVKRLKLKDSKEDKDTELKDTEIIFVDTQKKVKYNRDKRKPKIIPEKAFANNSSNIKITKDILITDGLNLRPQKILTFGHSRNPDISKIKENIKSLEILWNRNQKTPRLLVKQKKPRNLKKVTTTESSSDSDNQRNYAKSRNADNNMKSSDNSSNAESQRELENPRSSPGNPKKSKRPGYSKESGLAIASEEKDALSDGESTIHIDNNPKTKTVKNIGVSQTDSVTLRIQIDNKSAHIFLDNKKKQEDSSSDTSNDDGTLTKDMFKTSVLRQAYGDACLKLVVRKCYRACKNTIKSSCRIVKCRSEIKSYFKRRYKCACEKVFEGTPGIDLRKLNSESHHVDITREGYLSVACQPQIGTGMPALRQSLTSHKGTINASNTKGRDIELNILRDRYEKACQRLSRSKCIRACNYAQNATCVKFECEKKLKKNFRRNCKSQCKIAYTSTSEKKDSDDDSDSGSDSDESGSDESDDE